MPGVVTFLRLFVVSGSLSVVVRPGTTDNGLRTNRHPRRLPRPQPPVTIINLGPNTNLPGYRINFRTDENDFATKCVLFAAGFDDEPNWPSNYMLRILGSNEPFRLQPINIRNPQRLLPRLSPLALPGVNLHDHAIEW